MPGCAVPDEHAIDARIQRRAAVRCAVDLIGAVVLLVAALPLMVFAALAIRLDDGGPWLYRQERVGRNRRPFLLLKFRTMRTDAEADGEARWAGAADPRVTRVGGFLRRTRIDELPQLVNVLRGEMSLIGPRPERPSFVEQLERELPGYALRHRALPGLTGYAQVHAGYSASVAEAHAKLAGDLHYLQHQSLALDVEIAARTVAVVLTGRGAR